MRVLKFSDVNGNLRAAIDQVIEDADAAVISGKEAPDAVIMSLDFYNSWMETTHLLSSSANCVHLATSIEQWRAGQAKEHDLIDPGVA